MTASFDIHPLASAHQRDDFSCGVLALDRYLQQQASQDVRRNVTNCFVAADSEGRIAGYYTLAASSISVDEMPSQATRKLPRYPVLPAALIGRLAVDTRFRGRGLGGALLVDSLARAQRNEAAVFALKVDAKDAQAAAFYVRHGFRPLASAANRLFLVAAHGITGV